MKRKLFFLLTLFFVGIGSMIAQNQVRGTVVDNDGEPIIGATIQIKGTSQGTVTNLDGSFTLSAPAGSTLIISYVGYTTQELPISSNMRVILQSDAGSCGGGLWDATERGYYRCRCSSKN